MDEEFINIKCYRMIKCECKKCNSIHSEVKPENQFITLITNKTAEEEKKLIMDLLLNDVNNFPTCSVCGSKMRPILSLF